MLDYLEVYMDNSLLLSVVPVKIYVNTDVKKKLEILDDNKGKSGIYRWINNISGKYYIGSSVNLKNRFLQYFIKSLKLKKVKVLFIIHFWRTVILILLYKF